MESQFNNPNDIIEAINNCEPGYFDGAEGKKRISKLEVLYLSFFNDAISRAKKDHKPMIRLQAYVKDLHKRGLGNELHLPVRMIFKNREITEEEWHDFKESGRI